jgi:SAM-dependent methyltransferase
VSEHAEPGRRPDEWWRSFFSGLAVETWTRANTDAQTRAEVDLLLRILNSPARARILDVPCGQGRHAVELAGRGLEVTGVDLSSEMLDLARAQALRKGVRIECAERDMRNLPWPSRFDGACCFGNSFGYMDDAGNQQFLAAVARALKPGGRFVIEAGAAAAEVVLPTFQERRWFDYGDVLFLLRNRYDHVQGVIETEFTFVTDEKVERRMGYQRIYSYREIRGLCLRAGFGQVEGISGLGGEPFRLGSARLLLVATKND